MTELIGMNPLELMSTSGILDVTRFVNSSGTLMDLFAYIEHQWFAIQVRPNHEKVTALLLRGKGYEEFLPSYLCNNRLGRGQPCERPLFPGYLFCRFNPKV